MPTTTVQIDRSASLPGFEDQWPCGRMALEVSAAKANMRRLMADDAGRTTTWRTVLDHALGATRFPVNVPDPLDGEYLSSALIVTVTAGERSAAALATSWVGPEVALSDPDTE